MWIFFKFFILIDIHFEFAFEHFFDPKEEIETIVSILSPGGVIGIMTLRYDKNTDFKIICVSW